MLMGSRRESFKLLKDPVPSGQTFLIFDDPPAPITERDYLGLGTETMYVTSIDLTQNRVNVIRGVDDTVAPVSHPAGTKVEIQWRFFTADLLAFLTDEIRSWPDSIFTVAVTPILTIPTGRREIDLPLTRFRFPLDVTAKRSARFEWVPVPVKDYRIKTGLPTTFYPSGNALTVTSRWHSSLFLIEYAQSFDLSAVEDVDTDTDDIGFSEHLFDAAMYGVAWRALAGEEANRSDNNSQPEPREAAEVEPFDAMRSASAYKAIRDLRLEEEKRRLRQLYTLKVA